MLGSLFCHVGLVHSLGLDSVDPLSQIVFVCRRIFDSAVGMRDDKKDGGPGGMVWLNDSSLFGVGDEFNVYSVSVASTLPGCDVLDIGVLVDNCENRALLYKGLDPVGEHGESELGTFEVSFSVDMEVAAKKLDGGLVPEPFKCE